MVRRITAAGVAGKDGKLHVGDKLVSVNGASLRDLPHASVLQALAEAGKEVNLVVWRDPQFNLASSSMHSLGSYSNLSGSRSSLLSEDLSGEGSPSTPLARKHKFSRVPASPLVTRYSFAGIHSPPEVDPGKRWSDGNVVNYSPIPFHEPSPALKQRQTSVEDLGPDLPDSAPPPPPPDADAMPPELPETQPPNLPFQDIPEVSSRLPQLASHIASSDENLLKSVPPEIPQSEPPSELPLSEPPPPPPEEPPSSEMLVSEPSDVPSSASTTDTSKQQPPESSRPSSLKVPRGARLENSPFEIELKKTMLSNLGVTLTINEMGMLAIKSLTTRGIVAQDGNIRYVHMRSHFDIS